MSLTAAALKPNHWALRKKSTPNHPGRSSALNLNIKKAKPLKRLPLSSNAPPASRVSRTSSSECSIFLTETSSSPREDRANAPSTSRTTPRQGTRLGTRIAATRSCQRRAFLTATRPCSTEVSEPERRILGQEIWWRYERDSDGSAQNSENQETQEGYEPHRRALGLLGNHERHHPRQQLVRHAYSRKGKLIRP